MVAVDSLIPYARNARTHSEDQVAQIAASISEFGFTNPILTDGDKGVIAGHGRLAACLLPSRRAIKSIRISSYAATPNSCLNIWNDELNPKD